MKLFDTHTHLLDSRFDADRAELMLSLPEKGIAYLLEASTFAPDSTRILDFAQSYPFVFAALGTHPHEAANMKQEHLPELRRALGHEKAVAVGEIGLDYHYDFSPRAAQKHWFDIQLGLARELKLPVVLHVREAYADALDILRQNRDGLSGVMHCFSGSYETAVACLDMGLYIAFGGALTFANAKRNVEVAQRLPLDRLLIETDCPYMAPVPHRSKRNDPSLVRLVCRRLAEIKGLDCEAVAAATLENAIRLFC